MEIKVIEKEINKEIYYNIFYNNNWYNIKKEEIQLNLGQRKIGLSTIKKYMKLYY